MNFFRTLAMVGLVGVGMVYAKTMLPIRIIALMAFATFTLISAGLAEEQTKRAKSAEVVNVQTCPDFKYRVGDVSVDLANGKKELWTSKGNCLEPKVSHDGTAVGWVHFSTYEGGIHPSLLGETLQIRFIDGIFKEFKTGSSEQPFIQEWGFADNGSAVIIKSRGHHGPQYLVKYKISNGEVLGRVEGPRHDDMPDWAEPFSD
jgi:hypothetical protein